MSKYIGISWKNKPTLNLFFDKRRVDGSLRKVTISGLYNQKSYSSMTTLKPMFIFLHGKNLGVLLFFNPHMWM